LKHTVRAFVYISKVIENNTRGNLDMINENKFQAKLIKEIKEMFPGCVVLKNDSSYLQGVPDLSIYYKDKWAMLEVKKNAKASKQPNQEYYVDKLNDMSFARFIFPENKEETLNDLRETFGVGR
jgi:hypothetical protein